MKSPLLGAHMSIAGGVNLALERGDSIGCTAIQIFLKNNNRWVGKEIPEDEAKAFREAWSASEIQSVFAHACYLLNLASNQDALYEKSIAALVDEVERADLLKIPFIVLHPGSTGEETQEWGIARIVEAVNQVCKETSGSKVAICFEGTAGQGRSIGHTFEHLAALLDGVKKKTRACICLDTCHLFAAGYDLREKKAYLDTMKRLDEIVGLERLAAIHLNDSKKGLGSRVDRHEHIGKGMLGPEPFRNILRDRRLLHVPKVLETPKGPDLREDVENLKTLRNLLV
ncbi:deoxyribonuclease IV [bacterium]|nr:deoxyribonuclease IV [bacterium]